MCLDRLPEELLIMVLKQLDLTSVQNLYNTGNQHLQNAITSHGAIKKCRLSLSTMATVQTIKMLFFKSISKNLQDLDLSAVHDLKKTALLPAIKKMKKLVTLNVAYTNITIFDLLELYELCPTIKNITINYQFFKLNTKINLFSQDTLIKCQNLFSNFDNVHFVGSYDNLLHSNLPLNMLQNAKLKSLTYTIAMTREDNIFCSNNEYIQKKPLYCNQFTINMLYWKYPFLCNWFRDLPDITNNLSFEFEYIHIHDCSITISPVFENYFKEKFSHNRIYVKPCITTSLLSKLNQYIMIWNKQTTKFDEGFFSKLDSDIKRLEPCIVTYSDSMPHVVLPNDWVCVIHPLIPDSYKKIESHEFKKRRVSSPNVTIDYDNLLKDKKSAELTICFYDHIHRAVTLSASSNFLKKLTFLQLRGAIRYSREFFNILFRCCHNLVTLDVEGYPVSPCAPPISRSVPLSRSIKNIRISDKSIDLNTLFSSLGQCSRLENIMIIDSSKVSNDVPATDALFKQCDNLYYLCICGSMSDTTRTKKLIMLNKAKQKYNRHHLYIEVLGNNANDVHSEYSYDPFVDVFRLVVKEDYVAG